MVTLPFEGRRESLLSIHPIWLFAGFYHMSLVVVDRSPLVIVDFLLACLTLIVEQACLSGIACWLLAWLDCRLACLFVWLLSDCLTSVGRLVSRRLQPTSRDELLHGFLAGLLARWFWLLGLLDGGLCLKGLLISHWNESKERAHRDSRKVVVEIPYPLRSDNLLTCLMSLIWAFIAIVAINSWLSGQPVSRSWGHFLAASHCEAIWRICLALIPSCDCWSSSPDQNQGWFDLMRPFLINWP